jgi:UDPglucose--hexose-1-phosphate uridylyltransferase
MPELRKDPIIGRWVIISVERGKRPSDFITRGQRRKGGFCPFCPGNEYTTPNEIISFRQSDSKPNSKEWTLRVVPNKFPALQVEGGLGRAGEGIYDMMNGIGAHEVIIESPDHEATMSTMPLKALEDVMWAFHHRMGDLKKDSRFRYALIFKNEGEVAGATLEHTHSQLIATPIVPSLVKEEMEGARRYFDYKERCIFCDIVHQELETGARVVWENRNFIALEPYAPRVPFETWIMPKQHESHFDYAYEGKYAGLAEILQQTLKRMDRILDTPPYNFVIHTSPFNTEVNDYYHWHIEIMPKLTKPAGFEWGSGFHINPTPPEEAAKFLREARI